MKSIITVTLFLTVITAVSCKKDHNGLSDSSSGKLYVRSLYSLAFGTVSIDWYYLGNNGDLVKNPKNGVQPITMTQEKSNNLQYTGTYKTYVSNSKDYIKIKWSSGDSTIMGLKYANGDIVEMDAAGTMIRQNGLPAGYKLNNKYQGMSTDMSFVFTNTGTFTFKDYNYNSSAWETYTGKYEVKGNNLKLSFDEGSVLFCLLAVLDDGSIIINREIYEKQ